MSTPKLKLLLQAIRLGQPQDPQAAIAALAEAIAAQSDTIEELRSKLAVVQSRAQILDAKVALLETDMVQGRMGGDGPSLGNHAAHHSPEHPPKTQSVAPPPMPQASHAPNIMPPIQQGMPATQQGPMSHGPAPTRRPPSIAPPAPPPPLPDARPHELIDADSSDDFSMETAVISRRDVEALRVPDLPFRMPSAGLRPENPRASIPGAPWARRQANPAPIPQEEFTVDGPAPSEEDGETYRDAGGNALSRLGIQGAGAPQGDPRQRARHAPEPESAESTPLSRPPPRR